MHSHLSFAQVDPEFDHSVCGTYFTYLNVKFRKKFGSNTSRLPYWVWATALLPKPTPQLVLWNCWLRLWQTSRQFKTVILCRWSCRLPSTNRHSNCIDTCKLQITCLPDPTMHPKVRAVDSEPEHLQWFSPCYRTYGPYELYYIILSPLVLHSQRIGN